MNYYIRKRFTKPFFILIAATAILFAFVSVVPAQEDHSSGSVEIQVAGLKGPTSVGMLHLFDSKPDFGPGEEVEYQIVPTPELMISRVLSGEVDMAALPMNAASILYNKGVPYRLGAVTGYGLFYLVTTRDDISDFRDLRNKKVAFVARNSTPDYVTQFLMEHHGVLEDVERDYTFNHVELPPNMIAGRVDTAVLPEPFVTIVTMKQPEARIVFDLQQEWKKIHETETSYPVSAFFISNKLIENRPRLVERFLSEYEESIQWAVDNPERAGALAQEYMDLPAPVIAQAMPRLNLRFVPALEARTDIERFFKVLYDFQPKSIGGSIPDDRFYYRAQK